MVDKPVVQYVVEELVARRASRGVLFVTGRRKRAIEDHFDADPELDAEPLIDPRTGLQILYTRQARPAGLGDALRYGDGVRGRATAIGRARSATRSSTPPPAAAPGIVPPADRGLRARAAPAAALAVAEVPDEAVSRYGIVDRLPGAGGDRSRSTRRGREAGPGAPSEPHRVAGPLRARPGGVRGAARDPCPTRRGEVQLDRRAERVIERGGRVVAVPLGDGRAPARHRHGRELLRRVPRARADATRASAPRCAPRPPRCSMADAGAGRGAALRARGAGRQPVRRLRRRGAGGDARRAAREARGHAGGDARASTPAERAGLRRPCARFARELARGPRAATAVTWRTSIPRGVGLGGSSAIVIATLRALCELHGVALAPRRDSPRSRSPSRSRTSGSPPGSRTGSPRPTAG